MKPTASARAVSPRSSASPAPDPRPITSRRCCRITNSAARWKSTRWCGRPRRSPGPRGCRRRCWICWRRWRCSGRATRGCIRANLDRHCEERSDEAIRLSVYGCVKAGLLRGACHRARIRTTRWLAITNIEGHHIMLIKERVCLATGAASGIGEAVARAYAEQGALGVVVADLKSSRERLAKLAGDIDALAVTADVGEEADIKALIAAAEAKYGPVDVFFSNAGLSRKGQETAEDADWDVSWRVHVMSHVFAARALVPGMLARGSGYLLNTASAAGPLASLDSVPYRVTKHAAVALAEHLAIRYGDRGIRVSVLCPQSVQAGMTTAGPTAARVDGVMQPAEVARIVIEAMAAERFLILSHPQVHEYMQRKAADTERWLTGMRRLRDKIYGAQQAG